MTVAELIQMLENCDADAEVRIMSQESWPFEVSIRGVVARSEMGSEECECDHRDTEPHEAGCPACDETEYEGGLAGNDVFIVEGRQERYGDKRAWQFC